MHRANLGVLPIASWCWLLSGCSGAGVEPPGETASSETEQSVQAQGCRPDYVLAFASNVVCKIDKDSHVVYNTFELSSADLYRDRNGCGPDAFQLRRIDSINCSFSTSTEDCVGRQGAQLGDMCQRPRVSDFVGSVTAPATVNVQPGPLGAGNAYVCWSSSFDSAQVWVSDGVSERLFGTGRSGCASESNIFTGQTRTFTLYTDGTRAINLADARSVGVASPCPPGTGPKCGEACYPLNRVCL